MKSDCQKVKSGCGGYQTVKSDYENEVAMRIGLKKKSDRGRDQTAKSA